MANRWFAAYYSKDVEVHLQAASWGQALSQALDKQGDHRGILEALELTTPMPANSTRGHPSD